MLCQTAAVFVSFAAFFASQFTTRSSAFAPRQIRALACTSGSCFRDATVIVQRGRPVDHRRPLHGVLHFRRGTTIMATNALHGMGISHHQASSFPRRDRVRSSASPGFQSKTTTVRLHGTPRGRFLGSAKRGCYCRHIIRCRRGHALSAGHPVGWIDGAHRYGMRVMPQRVMTDWKVMGGRRRHGETMLIRRASYWGFLRKAC